MHRTAGLRTWQGLTLQRGDAQVRVTALPGRHAGRRLLRGLLPPVMGSMLESGPVRDRLGCGCTSRATHWCTTVSTRSPGVSRPPIWPSSLGRYPPPRRLSGDHGRPTGSGAEPARRLDPRLILPVHYEDHTVMRSPLSAFLAEVDAAGLGDRLVHCRHEQRARLTATPGATPTVF
ncbi:hypothetical protein ABT373_18955 [Streptomyces sp. NPDC000070]|uniref:hypothetical protein n=1 Tax=Streptomyces sp. NPDC000070 TaxID=3154240 RepID=UPI00331EC2C4